MIMDDKICGLVCGFIENRSSDLPIFDRTLNVKRGKFFFRNGERILYGWMKRRDFNSSSVSEDTPKTSSIYRLNRSGGGPRY